jgi:hypothetical protein
MSEALVIIIKSFDAIQERTLDDADTNSLQRFM